MEEKGVKAQALAHKLVSKLLIALTHANTSSARERPFDQARAQAMHLLFFVMALQRCLVPDSRSEKHGWSTEELSSAMAEWQPGLILCGELDIPHSEEVDLALQDMLRIAEEGVWPTNILGGLLDQVDTYAKPHGENGAQARYERRYSGAYYTNQRLVTTVVRETLRPLLEEPRDEADLLALNIIDPAVGSGNFLVEVLRQLTQALHELSSEHLAWCSRKVLEQCVYGVDVDPLAAIAARCTLWLEAGPCDLLTLQNHIIVGDSLLGACPQGFRDFDAVVGNPPWNKIKADLKEFYGHYDPMVFGMQGSQLKKFVSAEFERKPALQDKWIEHQHQVQQYASSLLRSPDYIHLKARVRGRASGGDSDFYKFFLERSYQLARHGGRLGLVLPAALCTAEGAVGLRQMLINETRIDALITVENKDRVFPIDSRFKYLVLVAERGRGPTAVLPSRYMLTSTDQVEACLTDRNLLEIPTKALVNISPENCTFVDVRESLDIDLLEKLHGRFPTLGTKITGGWNIRFVRELDMTNDSDLFKDYNELSEKGYQRESRGCLRDQEGNEYVPLLEGRMVHQFDHTCKAYVNGHGRKAAWKQLPWTDKRIVPHYYVERQVADRIPGCENLRAGYCDVTGQTNERTILAALIPPKCVAGNKVPTLRIEDFDGDVAHLQLFWLAVANSFVVDWLMRIRMSTTINFFHWYQIPFPRVLPTVPEAAELISAAARLSAAYQGDNETFVESAYRSQSWLPAKYLGDTNQEGHIRQFIRAKIDARVAAMYGLSIHEYAYVLSTFPLLDRQQPPLPGDHEVRSYITRDLALLAYCRHIAIEPPNDIVAMYHEVGIDISQATGSIRNLEERVEQGLIAGAVAYVPTGIVRSPD